MGDIVATLRVSAISAEGALLGRPMEVKTLVDTGSTRTVISSSLALRLGGSLLGGISATFERREVPLKLVALRLRAPGCRDDVIAVAVDDRLVRRAGDGFDAVLGHDYLEHNRIGLRYGRTITEILGQAAPLRQRRKRRAASE
jgi:hypothetical protein